MTIIILLIYLEHILRRLLKIIICSTVIIFSKNSEWIIRNWRCLTIHGICRYCFNKGISKQYQQVHNYDERRSYFARGYDYKGKYLFSARWFDASTRFGPGNKVGYFPSFTGWVKKQEGQTKKRTKTPTTLSQ
jgi:hypothetical protein